MAGSDREAMLAGVPGEPRTIEAGGVRTSVIELGEGPPLLLVHGAIECGAAMWGPVLPALASRHRVVAPDVPGLGESEPVDPLDAATFGRWLADVTEATGLDRPALVAHSALGTMTARLAARGTDLFDRLVLYGAPGVGPYRMPRRLQYVAIRFAIRPTPGNAERFDRFALLDLDRTRERDPAWFDAFASYNLSQGRRRHVKDTMNRLVRTEVKGLPESELARIEVPVDLLWGRGDRMVPLAVAEHASARHGWPLHVVEDAAHAPHIEQPSAFVATLESLLTTA